MRQVKFRAWLQSENRMVEAYTIHFQGLPIGAISCIYVLAKNNSDFVPAVDFILMQSSGIKDINGKDVYECDNVLLFGDIKARIVFQWGAFGYIIENRIIPEFITFASNSNISIENDCCAAIEVISNIYEYD